MIVKVREVYSCEHCGRSRLTKHAIVSHEPHCIHNPERRCRWQSPHVDHGYVELAAIVAELRDDGVVLERLREQTDGCPACMLAAIVQAGVHGEERGEFDYETEKQRWRAAEAEAMRGVW